MAADNAHDEHSDKHAGGGQGGHGGHGHGGGNHGGGSHEEHEGAPEWLISFADNTALMMGFFVIMLALAMSSNAVKASGGGSTEGEGEFGGMSVQEIEWTLGVREGFNNPVKLDSTDPREAILVSYLKKKNAGMSDAADDGLKGREHDVESVRRSGIFGAGGGIRFASGSSELEDEALEAIAALAEQFRGTQTRLDLRGHCSAAEAFEQNDRGMRLSYERAMGVARGLAELGIEWRRLRVTACADGDRVVDTAYDAESHARNQRVEVFEVGGSSTPITP